MELAKKILKKIWGPNLVKITTKVTFFVEPTYKQTTIGNISNIKDRRFRHSIFILPFISRNILFSRMYCSNNYTPKRISAEKRIGPHHIDVLTILIGSLLGDGSLERKGRGTRFCFYQEKSHAEYLLWLHSCLSKLGYCKSEVPKIITRSGLKGSRYILRFRTFTFSSFNWIYEGFYPKGRKVLPDFIEDYLNPQALAIWICDDGTLHKNRGIRFCTHNFTLDECKILQNILINKYNLKSSLVKITRSYPQQYNIYILKSSMDNLRSIVLPFMPYSMLYKLGK